MSRKSQNHEKIFLECLGNSDEVLMLIFSTSLLVVSVFIYSFALVLRGNRLVPPVSPAQKRFIQRLPAQPFEFSELLRKLVVDLN